MLTRDLKYLLPKGDNDDNVPRECPTPEECFSSFSPEAIKNVNAIAYPDET